MKKFTVRFFTSKAIIEFFDGSKERMRECKKAVRQILAEQAEIQNETLEQATFRVAMAIQDLIHNQGYADHLALDFGDQDFG